MCTSENVVAGLLVHTFVKLGVHMPVCLHARVLACVYMLAGALLSKSLYVAHTKVRVRVFYLARRVERRLRVGRAVLGLELGTCGQVVPASREEERSWMRERR